ncbi:sulfatase-like hydrolase/transferase [Roseiconus lacunae]|uniref:sulfatase-like hydrolase/transferase n=1 Tax=Roseiconus lacunae TaxID=2605694 RepID=UPI001357590D|nr:sulfatase-like hydrolase/transferase [Roseiconus lacunae]
MTFNFIRRVAATTNDRPSSRLQKTSEQKCRRVVFPAIIIAVTLMVQTSVLPRTYASDRPNVLIVLTDDQGWGDVGVHGNSIIETPAIDQLANQSARMEHFYVSPVCAPTRAALLTGRYPERSGVIGVTGRREVMRSEETTMAERFKAAGYVTGCFGKWHNGAQIPLHPNGQGFDEFFGFCGGHFNLYDDPVLERNGKPVSTQGYITDLLTDQAIEFVKANHKQPFFCYVPFNAPHGPFQVDRKLFDKYNDGSISEKTAAVYAMVENIDTNLARLLTTLDEHELAENTIVIFLTDNGPNGKRFNGGMRGAKGSVHEGGCRVPCFIRWPAKVSPKSIDQIAAHIDLLPTLADWCELPADKATLDGRSLTTLIESGNDPALAGRHLITLRTGPRFKTSNQWPGRFAVRNLRYRLVSEKPGMVELYDMGKDPGQKQNVADKHLDLADRLKQAALDYYSEIQPSVEPNRPVPISGARPTMIPSVDAKLTGNPGFADEIEWAHSWVDRWFDRDDLVTFSLDVRQAGRYSIQVHYATAAKNAEVIAKIANSELRGNLKRVANKSVIRPDLDSKATPRRMLDFSVQTIGVCELESGMTELQLSLAESVDRMVELGGVTLTRCEIPEPKQFHLFLLAGQSNMAGRGKVIPTDRYPDDRILMLDQQNRWVPAVDPLHFDKSVAGVGLGREFARVYAAAHPDVTVGLIPCAAGGSPIKSWVPGGYHDQTKSHPYDDAMIRVQIAQQDGVVKGILWHQGESDSKSGAAELYRDRLREVFARFRKQVGTETPILIGGLATANKEKWNDARKQVDQAHRELANELEHAAFVESSGLTLKSDNTHFDRESLLEFGRRYAEALPK